MVSFTQAQKTFLKEFFESIGLPSEIMTSLELFTQNYRPPVRKREPLPHDLRCTAVKKDRGRCTNRRLTDKYLCVLHDKHGTPNGVVPGEDFAAVRFHPQVEELDIDFTRLLIGDNDPSLFQPNFTQLLTAATHLDQPVPGHEITDDKTRDLIADFFAD